MKKSIVYTVLFTAFISLSVSLFSQDYIAGFTVATEEVLRSIPEEYINKAREELIVAFQHTSHGTHVSRGMYGLPDYKSGDEILFAISRFNQEAGKLFFRDEPLELYPPGAKDLSDYDTLVVETTRNFLDAEENADVNVVMWAWCEIEDHDLANNYLPDMETLIAEYGAGGTRVGTGAGQREVPVTFVFMTGHATTNYNVGERRPKSQAQEIIDHCLANGHLCLDYYSIDTHDMENSYWEDAGPDGNSESYGGNFYQDWQDAHSVGDGYYENLSSPGGDVKFGTHTTQHISSNRKAYAMWWILARIAGWDGENSIGVSASLPEGFVLYPNPGNGIFIIEASALDIEKIKVVDTLGKTVKLYENPESNTAQIRLDLSGIQPGFYIVRMTNKDQSVFSSTLIIN